MAKRREFRKEGPAKVKTLDLKLIDSLEKKYGPLWETIWPEEYSFKEPFKKLIITVLSQNTSEANCIRAYNGLRARFNITPQVLAEAKQDEIKEAIRSGGLYNVKAKRIKELSKAVLEKFRGDLSTVLNFPKEEAKKRLMELPGIGDKTADVLLTSRYSYQRVIPIDTHFERVTKRIGLVARDADYNAVQKALMHFLPEERRARLSGLMWLLAKNTCRAKNPKCYECPLASLCEYKIKKEVS
ncbi:MAG: endonuclease III [bacterium (Candidatus Stahlbacteria) CG08_land_8_20_14_0_20_40_26]|nr:MAG: endonuclease III [bacterium (Candidatus Stahlbacteria) CG23_combo_of_CG06-09_8_20_14_all_40_9]PIS26303.1 MAG: endonuclease III [bacterium (Candidatus Stahlbacteria) CG08_land_8_20_14_0_20_40_26]